MTTYADMPGALLPIGHLVNARRAVQRYAEAGTEHTTGVVSDELDELRRLLLDVAQAFFALSADAMHTPGAPRREHTSISAVGDSVVQLVADSVQPVALRLVADVVQHAPGRNAA